MRDWCIWNYTSPRNSRWSSEDYRLRLASLFRIKRIQTTPTCCTHAFPYTPNHSALNDFATRITSDWLGATHSYIWPWRQAPKVKGFREFGIGTSNSGIPSELTMFIRCRHPWEAYTQHHNLKSNWLRRLIDWITLAPFEQQSCHLSLVLYGCHRRICEWGLGESLNEW